jgi:hypothetical protein
MFKKKIATGTASVERLKNRSLMVQEKKVVASVQAPPPASEELTKLIAERQAQEAEWRRTVEEKTRSLVAQERSIKNLRAVYECGTTSKMARFCYSGRRRCSTVQRIEEQNPGMFISFLGDGPGGYYRSSPNPLRSKETIYEGGTSEWEYARRFLERELGPDQPKCEHGKSWCVECELCDLDVADGEIEHADAKLAKGCCKTPILPNSVG